MLVARKLYEETLPGNEELCGTDHEKTYLLASDMAEICYKYKPRRAEELLQLSLRGKDKCLDATQWHPRQHVSIGPSRFSTEECYEAYFCGIYLARCT